MGPRTVLLNLRLGLILVGALLCSMFISIEPAFADLRVCNQTGNPVSIALGYRAERGWQSEGWWVATPSQCATVYQGALNSRFFYLYVADDIGGGAWDGSVYMCTRDETFTIFGVEDCLARGYERTGFFEVDTQNKSDWTLQLTDPEAGADTASGTDNPDPPAADPGAAAGTDTQGGPPLNNANDGPEPGDIPPDPQNGPPAAGDTNITD
jgi:uncharacterized membrane protein